MPDAKIWVPQLLKDKLLIEAKHVSPYETGGILLGYVGDNTDYVVTHLIGSGPEASYGRYHFNPDHEYQRSEINRIFSESNGENDYLGDWHTHPNGPCSMSWVDRRTLNRIGTTSGVNVKFPIMVIVCDGQKDWGISAWRYSRSRWLIGAETEDLVVSIY